MEIKKNKYTIITNIMGACFVIVGWGLIKFGIPVPIASGMAIGVGLMFIVFSKEIGGIVKVR